MTHESFLSCANRRTLLIWLTLVALHCPQIIHAQEQISPSTNIPIEVFAALPTFSGAKLSPSGEKLGYFAEVSGMRQLVISAVSGNNPLLVTAPEKQSFISYRWIDDTTVIYRTTMTLKRRSLRVKTTETRTYRLDLNTQKSLWLGAPDRSTLKETMGQHERIIDILPNDPEHLLIELDLNRNGDYEVYKINLNSGHRKRIEREQDGIQNWRTDPHAEIRLATGFQGKKRLARIKLPNGNWVDIDELPWAKGYRVQGFSTNPDIIYASGINAEDRLSLYAIDIMSGEVIQTLFSHQSFDMGSTVENPKTGEIIGVTYTDDFHRIKYLDKNFDQIQRNINKALPHTVNTILSHAEDKEWYFIYAEDAKNPGDYYIYDRPNGSLAFVANSRPQINPALAASTKRVTIPMRDGSTITGYLTAPNAVEHPTNLPTIVLPHGGPYGVRDTAAWDYEAQFYASRGYLVLKPNFRGSGGYGIAFRVAGHNQWGGLMQDDITDATHWLISEGYADADRLCIIGSSFGGYAALMGIIQQDTLYKCAVSINGVTDLTRMKNNDRIYTVGGRSWSNRWGLAGAKDTDFSPFHRAYEVSAPILLIASIDDARVPFKLSVDMHEKLQKFGKKSRFVRIENGTHNMVTAKSRYIMLKEIEQFLAQHIGH